MGDNVDITHKIDAVTKIGENRIAMGGIQPPPKSVKIELTARCCLRCKFCALRTRKTQPKDDMNFEFFKKITTDMRYSGVEEIGLFYLGESFMASDLLIKATEFCKKELEFPWVFLTSNAVNAKPEYVFCVMKAGLDSLKWSMNANNAEEFKRITGGSEKLFDEAVRNVRAAHYIRDSQEFKTMLSASSILFEKDTKEKFKDFLDVFVRPFVDRHYWLPIYQMGMYKTKIEKELGVVPTAGNMGRLDDETLEPTRQPLPCWAAFTEGHVRVDGGLSACCFGSDARFDMGMLDGTNFMEQWNSEKFQKIRKSQIRTLDVGPDALKGTPCKVCVAYEG